MELRKYGWLLLKWWWLLSLGAALSGSASYVVSISQDPVYRATATLMVDQAQSSMTTTYESVMISERLRNTYAELIQKPRVMEAVQERLGDTAKRIGGLTARVIPNTQLLELSVEGEIPAEVQLGVNTIGEVFIAQRQEDQSGESTASRQVLRQQITDLGNEIKATSTALESAKAAQQSGEIARLQSTLSQQQVTYSQLLQSEQAMRLEEARTFNSVKLVQPALRPGAPVRPRPVFNTILGSLAGLVLAFGLAFLLEYLDDTVKAAADVQASIGLATLGSVARFVLEKSEGRGVHLLDEQQVRSHVGEAYRILRANLDFAWAGQPGKVVMVTSPHPGEGKTTTLVNLAGALARDNRRVVLVDADVRRPTVHRAFGIESRRGLCNVLADPTACVDEFVVPTNVPNLRVLPCGPVPPNPSELLGSANLARLLDDLKQSADLVLVDSPPVLAVVDPLLVSSRVDGVLLVVEAGATRIQSLIRATDVLSRSSARMLGVVLNKLTRQSDDYYYHYYHYYSYSDRSRKTNGVEAQREEAKT